MEIKLNNFKNDKNPKKNTVFIYNIRISIEKTNFSIRKLAFSIENYMSYTKHCVLC